MANLVHLLAVWLCAGSYLLVEGEEVSDYAGPNNYIELSDWHAKRIPFKTERVGQAFFNDFGFQTENSYYCEDPFAAWTMIVDALEDKFEDFYEGINE